MTGQQDRALRVGCAQFGEVGGDAIGASPDIAGRVLKAAVNIRVFHARVERFAAHFRAVDEVAQLAFGASKRDDDCIAFDRDVGL